MGQFTPAWWDKDEWHPMQGPLRFFQVLCLCVAFMTVELNTFFLKFSLWIPPRNPLVVYRLILWWLIAIPTIREYNSYIQDRFSLSFSHSHTHNYVQNALKLLTPNSNERQVSSMYMWYSCTIFLAFPQKTTLFFLGFSNLGKFFHFATWVHISTFSTHFLLETTPCCIALKIRWMVLNYGDILLKLWKK